MSDEKHTRRDYIDTVTSIVEDIFSDLEIKTQEQYEAHQDDVQERIWQDVDGSEWIIYTYLNNKVLEYTENEDAYEEQGMELDTSKGFSSIRAQVAFMAMYQDAMEELSRTVDDLPADDSEIEAEEVKTQKRIAD